MSIFLSLFIVFFFGITGGILLEKIRIPKIIWYIILGILIGPSLLNIVDDTLVSLSSTLRQIALIIILTRSGLSLDFNSLKKIGRPALLMCFVPATFEIIGIAIFGPMLLKISILEAFLLGSVLAAVSPAIVVPRMINLMEKGYGKEHHVPELVLAGASCDDIFVIVLFYSFKNLVATSSFDVWGISQIPISIVSGILVGLAIGFALGFLIKKFKFNNVFITIAMLSLSFGLVALENILKPYFSFSSLLSIIVLSLMIKNLNKEKALEVQKTYNSLWQGFEILLFTLVGIAVDVKYAFSKEGAIIVGLILIGLAFRSLGVLVSVLMTDYTKKEKLFIIFSYIPKATVQASIGAIALSEGLGCGALILTAAVISILLTAPLGAILIDNTYKKLIKKV